MPRRLRYVPCCYVEPPLLSPSVGCTLDLRQHMAPCLLQNISGYAHEGKPEMLMGIDVLMLTGGLLLPI